MPVFRYHPDIFTRYPALHAAIVLVDGLENTASPPSLQSAYLEEQRQVLDRLGNTPLSEVETLAAWRQAFRGFGVEPTKYRSAPEALLRRLTKKGDIPFINSLVDICNLVSIRYALPVAAVDTRHVQGGITVHFAQGSEPFTDLGQAEIQHPEPGEVVFTDEGNVVMARRWCWRQSDQSAAQLDTQDAIITIEAQHPGGEASVYQAAQDLVSLARQYLGGSYTIATLDLHQQSVQEAT
jgi:DNA/RNA-binding domain of Phe-tRNA-synthetase-like protein